MSAGLVTGVALLGALAGSVAVPLARRFAGPAPAADAAGPPRADGTAEPRGVEVLVGPDGMAGSPRGHGVVGPLPTAGEPGVRRRPAGRLRTSLTGAVVCGGLAAALGADPALPALLFVAAVGLVLALVDLACLRLPDPLVALAAAGGGSGLVAAALVAGTPGRLLAAVAGAGVSFAGYVLLALLPGPGSASAT
ncbi:hypothetical protein [Micromonospora sp. NPDC003776]